MKPPKHFQALALEVANNDKLPRFQNCKSWRKTKGKKKIKFSNVKKIFRKETKEMEGEPHK